MRSRPPRTPPRAGSRCCRRLASSADARRTLQSVLLAISDAGRTFLGVLGVATLVFGFAAVIALAVYVIKRAPKDGTDIGRDPRLDPDARQRRNGGSRPE